MTNLLFLLLFPLLTGLIVSWILKKGSEEEMRDRRRNLFMNKNRKLCHKHAKELLKREMVLIVPKERCRECLDKPHPNPYR